MNSLSKNLLSVSARAHLRAGALILCCAFGLTGCGTRALTGLTIQPATGLTCVIPGVSAQFNAYGIYTQPGHATVTRDLTTLVTWSSTIPAVAKVSSSGLATGEGLGQTSIIASTEGDFGNVTATSNIQVKTSCTTTTTGP